MLIMTTLMFKREESLYKEYLDIMADMKKTMKFG
jgi:hypothetical protein